jgi:hypothetical protein
MTIRHNAARRRYAWRIVVLMTAYVVLLLGADAAFPSVRDQPVLAYALALIPALPILGVFWAIGRLLVEEPDEYLRHQLVRQSLIATAFMLTIATVWGFLETFGLAPHAEAYLASALWFGGLGIGGIINWLTGPPAEPEAA